MSVTSSSRAVRWAWAVMLVAALATRFLGLSVPLLAPAEAGRALASLEAARGNGWPASVESPLLLVGNALLFTIFGAGDVVARLLPALAGVALVALPLLWRRRLGDVGALVAAGLLLLSPLSLFASHRVNGAALSALGGGLLITVLLRPGQDHPTQSRWQDVLLATGLAIGLIGGPGFYNLLIPGLVAWLLMRTIADRATRIRWQPVVIGIVAAMLISLAFGLRWSGWAGITDGLRAWLGEWHRADAGSAPALELLLLYEPFLLVMWLAGIVLLWQRPTSNESVTSWALVVWGLLALVLTVLQPGSTPESLSAMLLPLALMGGYAVQRIVMEAHRGALRWMGLQTLVALVLWLPGLLALSQHAGGFAFTNQALLVAIGVLVLVTLQVLLAFVFTLLLPPEDLWRGIFLGAAAILLLLQVGFATSLTYVRADSPVEPAVGTATSPDVAHLVAMIHDTADLRDERHDVLPVVVVDGDSQLTAVLRWDLRAYDKLSVAPAWPDDDGALVITPEAESRPQPQDPGAWRGALFAATTTYAGEIPGCQSLFPPECSAFLKWYLYRTVPGAVETQHVILWRTGEAIGW